MAFQDKNALKHGDHVRWHSAGPADSHKVLGVETNRYGDLVIIVWDDFSKSVWSDRADLFVKVEQSVSLAEAA